MRTRMGVCDIHYICYKHCALYILLMSTIRNISIKSKFYWIAVYCTIADHPYRWK